MPIEKKKGFTSDAQKSSKRRFGYALQGHNPKQAHMEEKLWKILQNGACLGLKFHRQASIRGYTADFFCKELGIVLDLTYPAETSRQDNVALRRLMFSYMGLHEIRLRKDEVTRERVVAKLRPFLKT